MSVPAQNPADVLEFFQRTIADQIHLTAIDPEKHRGVAARDFGTNFTDAQIWAQARNEGTHDIREGWPAGACPVRG